MDRDLDAGEQLTRRDPQPRGDLRHRGDPHVTDAALGACQLDRMDPATMGQFLLGQAPVHAATARCCGRRSFRLELPGHPRDALALSRPRPEPVTFGSGMSPDTRRVAAIFAKGRTQARPTGLTAPAARSCVRPGPPPAAPPPPARGRAVGRRPRRGHRHHPHSTRSASPLQAARSTAARRGRRRGR